MRPPKYSLIFPTIFACVLLAIGQIDYKGTPVIKDGLIRASKDRGSASKLVALIKAQGVDFIVTSAIESELVAQGVKPDVIRVAKDNYRIPGSTKRASYLSVSSNVPTTGFIIDGVGSFVGDVSDRPMMPGTYRITAKRPGYSIDVQTVDLSAAGARRSLAFSLKPMSITDLLSEAESSLRSGDYTVVEENAREILRREPSNAKANILLGQSYYAKGDFQRAIEPFVKGITGGETAVFPGGRGKGGSWAGVSLSPGRFVLKASALAFISGEKDDFDLPYAKIEDLKVGQSESVFMNVRVPKSAGKGEEKKEFKFYPTTAQPAVAMGRLVTCNCVRESTFIVNLVTEIRIRSK
jgi:hypothetical protein